MSFAGEVSPLQVPLPSSLSLIPEIVSVENNQNVDISSSSVNTTIALPQNIQHIEQAPSNDYF